jgi:Regulator of chromosome condensation (RCC1) repeat
MKKQVSWCGFERSFGLRSAGFGVRIARRLFVLAMLLFLGTPVSCLAQVTPVAFSQPAGPVRATAATMNGMAWVKGYSSVAWFEWGADAQYGGQTEAASIGNGTEVIRVSAPITELAEGGVYHFRLVVSNALGVAHGMDQRFTTGMRIQNWGSYPDGLPSVPAGLTNLVAVAAGHGHCLAVRNDDTVAAWMASVWGYPSAGQTNVPPGLSNVVAVAGGFCHSLALKEDGTVVAWGQYADRTPVIVPAGLSNVIAVAGGDYHSVALRSDGTVVVWGENNYGQTNVPARVSNIVAISCGSSYTLALSASGQTYVWGGGVGAVAPFGLNLATVASESVYNLALSANGSISSAGAVGNDVPMPAHLTNVAAIATGHYFGMVMKTDGSLTAWGRAADATNIPPQLSNVVAYACGDYHSVALAPVNLPPCPSSISVAGGTNRDLVVRIVGYDPNGDAFNTTISSLPVRGALYQYTSTGRGAPITATGTILDNPNYVIFAPEPDEYGVGYASFGFSLSDGADESPAAQCRISIMPPVLIDSAGVLVGQTNAFALGFNGLTGGTYSVLVSRPLGAWNNLGAATEVSPGRFLFLDPRMANWPAGFYRVRSW